MAYGSTAHQVSGVARDAAASCTLADLAALLRALRRRDARRRSGPVRTYRELAERTGWSVTAFAEYFTGKTLPPTNRFDVLVGLLGADPAEQGALATARDRVDEHRRGRRAGTGASGAPGSPAPDGDRDTGRGAPAGVRPPVPRQLPPALAHLTGRRPELAELARLADTVADGVVIVVIAGTAGVGKTALAVSGAHRLIGGFPDGQLHADLRGFAPGGQAMPAAEAMRRFLAALGVPAGRVPPDLDAQAALYRSLLARRRMLVLLDNARDAEQVRPLLPGAPGCLVLVTSRNPLSGLVAAAGARLVALDVLSVGEAVDLLSGRLGAGRVAAEPAAAAAIVARCARLPLALAIVAARAAAYPRLPLGTLAEQLAAGDGLEPLAGTDEPDQHTDVRAVFSWSYRQLTPAAARLFRLLGRHPGGELPAVAAARLVGLPVAPTQRLLAQLVAVGLVGEPVPGRYACHVLLRAYAAGLSQAVDPERDRRAAALGPLGDTGPYPAGRPAAALPAGRLAAAGVPAHRPDA